MSTSDYTRAQAVLVMHYVEGWLSGADLDAASEHLREHLTEIADQMVEDECALPDDQHPQRRIEEHLGSAMLAGGGLYTADYVEGVRQAAFLAGRRSV